MKKPVIGISGSILVMENGRFPGYRRSYVNEDYVKSVIEAGGIPLIIPVSTDQEILASYFSIIDGLVLSGGHDVDPLQYGEQPLQKLGQTLSERDVFDKALVENALKANMPVLGICRGHQVLNVALGGSLYQDLDYIPNCSIKHDQFRDPSMPTHEIEVAEGSRLREILGSNRVLTNSFHHLAIKDMGQGLVVNAKADDGVIEGVEHPDYKFVVGVQWHPEMMALSDDKMMNLFKAVVEAAK